MSNKVIDNFRHSMKIPEEARWLVPGLQVKRWFALIFLGAVLMTLGVLILFDIKPVFYTMEFIRKVAMKLSLVPEYFLKAGRKQIFQCLTGMITSHCLSIYIEDAN